MEMAVYANLAILAAIVLVYGAVSGRLERSPVSGALVFMGVGFLLGPGVLGVLNLSVGTGELRLCRGCLPSRRAARRDQLPLSQPGVRLHQTWRKWRDIGG